MKRVVRGRGSVDEVELVQAAVFSLEQAAQRVETLAAQARTPALADHLRRIAGLLREQANTVSRRHGRSVRP
jgi:hypothetical protein